MSRREVYGDRISITQSGAPTQPKARSFDGSQMTARSGCTTFGTSSSGWPGESGRRTSNGAANTRHPPFPRKVRMALTSSVLIAWCAVEGAGLMFHATPSISSQRSSSGQPRVVPVEVDPVVLHRRLAHFFTPPFYINEQRGRNDSCAGLHATAQPQQKKAPHRCGAFRILESSRPTRASLSLKTFAKIHSSRRRRRRRSTRSRRRGRGSSPTRW